MNNLIIAKNYETFGEEGLTSNKVIYYKEDNMVKFRANITDNPYGDSEVVTVGGIGGIEAILLGESTHWDAPSELTSIRTYLFYTSNIKSINAPNVTSINTHAFGSTPISRFNSDEEGTLDLRNVTYIGMQAFRACNNIRKVYFSDRLNSIGDINFENSVEVFNFGNTRNTIPTIAENTFKVTENTKFIVPDALYDQWIAANIWSNYVDNIVKYSSDEFPVYYDYVQSTVTKAYIDTDYKPNKDTQLEILFSYDSFENESSPVMLGCCNAANLGDAYSGMIIRGGRISRLGFGHGSNTVIPVAAYILNTKYTVYFDKNKIFRNNKLEANLPVSTWTANYSLWLFGRNTKGILNYPSLGKIYYCKIYDNGTLVRDYKPCLYKGEAGIWDSVEGKFYGNANNTGTLTVGNDE